MSKKLYRVRVVLFVMAENESDACVAATQARFDIFECTARKAKNIDPEWKDAIPYNADDERVCSEILTNNQQAVCSRTYPMKLSQYVKAPASGSSMSAIPPSRLDNNSKNLVVSQRLSQ
ncbi:MAG: hypothetical protein HY865_05830 [Chloroflexi bacterium]|nr:hypothetical protein [Chloroflexota bacterium]